MKRILEIRAGEGGTDAKLFVEDLAKAYNKLFSRLGWLTKTLYEKPAEIGFFEIAIEISGNNLENLEQEAGGLRLQRVPPTEKRGRVHTSTVTVAVINPDIEIDERYSKRSDDDFRSEWFSGTGKGGQKRNKSQSCIRLIHIPTGIVETVQSRSRETSYSEAKEALLKQLDSAMKAEKYGTLSSVRKDQVGSGMRGDKIRTIRFQDDIVVDNRTGKRITAEEYMKGHMNKLWS